MYYLTNRSQTLNKHILKSRPTIAREHKSLLRTTRQQTKNSLSTISVERVLALLALVECPGSIEKQSKKRKHAEIGLRVLEKLLITSTFQQWRLINQLTRGVMGSLYSINNTKRNRLSWIPELLKRQSKMIGGEEETRRRVDVFCLERSANGYEVMVPVPQNVGRICLRQVIDEVTIYLSFYFT